MEHSTSINELPIDNAQIPDGSNDSNAPENNRGANTTSNIQLDPSIIPNNATDYGASMEKQVHIREDKNRIHQFSKNDTVEETFVLSDDMKIIILSTIIFFIFYDVKVRNYIMNVLCQVFGSFLKTDLGNISRIGTIFYSLTFGLTILMIVKVVDIKKLNLNF